MPHAHVVQKIPPIAQAFAGFTGFSSGRSRRSVILEHLRRVARRLQRANPTPFYSMREVAGFFEFPLRSVALIYASLEQEGLLVRVRGSHTKLTGRKRTPATPVRNVIGLPVWLSSIASSPYMRTLHVDLNGRLRRHGFVADSIFFNSREDQLPEFADRLLAHHLDWILWLGANFKSAPIFLALRDRGLRQIIVLPAETPLGHDLSVYLQDWKNAYLALAADWAAAGIRQVLTPVVPNNEVTTRITRHFLATLKSQGIETVSIPAGIPGAFAETARLACAQPGTAVAFLDMITAHEICNAHPQLLAEVARTGRLGFCRGAVPVPYFSQTSVIADVVGCDPLELSRRIVDDLASQAPLPPGINARFDATYHPRINLSIYKE